MGSAPSVWVDDSIGPSATALKFFSFVHEFVLFVNNKSEWTRSSANLFSRKVAIQEYFIFSAKNLSAEPEPRAKHSHVPTLSLLIPDLRICCTSSESTSQTERLVTNRLSILYLSAFLNLASKWREWASQFWAEEFCCTSQNITGLLVILTWHCRLSIYPPSSIPLPFVWRSDSELILEICFRSQNVLKFLEHWDCRLSSLYTSVHLVHELRLRERKGPLHIAYLEMYQLSWHFQNVKSGLSLLLGLK